MRICPSCVDQITFYDGRHEAKRLPVYGEIYLDEYEVIAHYEETIGVLIRNLKYTGIEELAKMLGEWIWWWGKLEWEVDTICHVPLHRERWEQRGFNQARELARVLAEKSGWPWRPLLERKRYTLNQAAADYETRLKQLNGIFGVQERFREAVTGKTILIIDDVLTTGSTFNQCARALKEAGAAKVVAVALAHKSS
jgi:ComF family protein